MRSSDSLPACSKKVDTINRTRREFSDNSYQRIRQALRQRSIGPATPCQSVASSRQPRRLMGCGRNGASPVVLVEDFDDAAAEPWGLWPSLISMRPYCSRPRPIAAFLMGRSRPSRRRMENRQGGRARLAGSQGNKKYRVAVLRGSGYVGGFRNCNLVSHPSRSSAASRQTRSAISYDAKRGHSRGRLARGGEGRILAPLTYGAHRHRQSSILAVPPPAIRRACGGRCRRPPSTAFPGPFPCNS
jgi:hypothetical protein